MRIISKFHDYYDSCMSYGQDERLIYKRETVELPVKLSTYPKLAEYYQSIPAGYRGYLVWSDIRRVLIGVAGKLYAGYSVTHGPRIVSLSHRYEYAYTDEQILKKLQSSNFHSHHDQSDLLSFYLSKEKKRMGEQDRFTQANVRKFTPIEAHDLFRQFNTPVFVYLNDRTPGFSVHNNYKLIINPCLRDYDFQSLMDPFTAYQEISMYLGGVLGSSQDIPKETDDKIIRDSKGFDERSFKQVSPGKKARRRNK